LVQNVLWLENHILENWFAPKFFIKNFRTKIVYGCKIISSKTGLHQSFSSKLLGRNFLWLQNHFLAKWFAQKIFVKNVLVENFLWLQNHSLENRFAPKFFVKNFFG